MDFDIARPILSGVAGGILATLFGVLSRRWITKVCNGKDAKILVQENRVAIWLANTLFFCGLLAGIAIYQLELIPKDDLRGLGLALGGGSIVALPAILLLALVSGKSPKEAYVAFAISQGIPTALLSGILVLLVAIFAAAVASLLIQPAWVG